MAISITITGLTAQQVTDVGNAFDATPGRVEAGLTKQQWVERLLLRHIKNVVKGWKRQAHETTLAGEQAQIDLDYLET